MTGEGHETRYRLLQPIGSGSTGTVWRAVDDLLDREVAVKRLPHRGAVHADGSREARTAARVDHPHVVRVLDLVSTDLETWVVMELVDGRDLAAVVRSGGPLEPRTVARLLAPVADALHHAHGADVVHRDVKPSNLLLGADDAVRLTDFGVARVVDDATATATGLVTGSPAYLAPEVALGARATPASDVWSLGATIVHLVTGQAPYHRSTSSVPADDSPLAVVHRVVHEPAPRPAAGPLTALLADMLQHDPAARPTMAAVQRRLADAAHARAGSALDTAALTVLAPGDDTAAPGPSARSRRRLTAVAAAAVLAVLAGSVGVGVVTLRGGEDDPVPTAGSRSGAASQGTTAAQLTAFARSYVATAHRDPAAGLRLLTADYQARSPRYADFWGTMKAPRILTMSADPTAMTVTYTYRYALPRQGERTETVTLQVVATADGLRIADAT